MTHHQISLKELGSDTSNLPSILVAGDFALDEILSSEPESIMKSELIDEIRNSDISMVNFEGTIANELDPVSKVGPAIEISERAPKVLSEAGFDMANLANNHSMDYGCNGLSQTIKSCEKSDLLVTGVGQNFERAMEPTKLNINNIDISILNFSYWEFVPNNEVMPSIWNLELNPTIGNISHPKATQNIVEANYDSDIVVAIVHGGLPSVPFPPIQYQERLRNFIEAGADIVIGHHPHVPQGWEKYKNGIIFYSLGNFLFDFHGRKEHPKQRWGKIVKLNLSESGISDVKILLTETKDQKVGSLDENSDVEDYTDYLQRLSSITQDREQLSYYWRAIASECYKSYPKSLKTDFGNESNQSRLLSQLRLIRWDSHRWVTETALAEQDRTDEIPPEVQNELEELWKWCKEEPFPSHYTYLARRIQSGCVGDILKRTGLEPYAITLYKLIKDRDKLD